MTKGKPTTSKATKKETASSLRLLKKQLKRAPVLSEDSAGQSSYACVIVEGKAQESSGSLRGSSRRTQGKKKKQLKTSEVIARNLSYLKRM